MADIQDAENEVLEISPDRRFNKLNRTVTAKDSSTVEVAHLAYDTEEGTQVVWNEIKFSDKRYSQADKSALVRQFRNLTQLKHSHIVTFIAFWVDNINKKFVFITEEMTSGTLKQYLKKKKKTDTVKRKEDEQQNAKAEKKAQRKKKLEERKEKLMRGEVIDLEEEAKQDFNEEKKRREERLTKTIREREEKASAPVPKLWIRWCRQILSALNFLHRCGLTHSDISLGTLFIQHNGLIKIGAISMSHIRTHVTTQNLKSSDSLGHLVAPEALSVDGATQKSDIYAFGMCLLEIATEERPYKEYPTVNVIWDKAGEGVLPLSLNKVYNLELKAFITRCLAPVDERPNAMKLLLDPLLFEVPSLTLVCGHYVLHNRLAHLNLSVSDPMYPDLILPTETSVMDVLKQVATGKEGTLTVVDWSRKYNIMLSGWDHGRARQMENRVMKNITSTSVSSSDYDTSFVRITVKYCFRDEIGRSVQFDYNLDTDTPYGIAEGMVASGLLCRVDCGWIEKVVSDALDKAMHERIGLQQILRSANMNDIINSGLGAVPMTTVGSEEAGTVLSACNVYGNDTTVLSGDDTTLAIGLENASHIDPSVVFSSPTSLIQPPVDVQRWDLHVTKLLANSSLAAASDTALFTTRDYNSVKAVSDTGAGNSSMVNTLPNTPINIGVTPAPTSATTTKLIP